MFHFDTGLFGALPQLDITEKANSDKLNLACKEAEYVAEKTHVAFTLVGLQPDGVYYYSRLYQSFMEYVGFHSPVRLKPWLDAHLSHVVPGLGDELLRELYTLNQLSLTSPETHPMLCLDYTYEGEDRTMLHMEVQIKQLYLHTRFPKHVLLCVYRKLDHIPGRYFPELRLVQSGNIIYRKPFAPPISQHKALQKLTPTCRRIVELYYNGESPRTICTILNISEGTLKKHRNQILKQFPQHKSIEALIEYLRRGEN